MLKSGLAMLRVALTHNAHRRALWAALLFLQAPLAAWPAQVSYNEVSGILTSRCVLCHQGPAAPLELRLDTLEAVLAGSRNGPVVVAGQPETSELLKRIKGTTLPRMPMTGPPFLSDEETALFEAWIVQGLDAGGAPSAAGAPPATQQAGAETPVEPAGPATWQQVAVIFATRCAKCHADAGLMGPAPEGYRLNSYADAVSAADRARIVPGNPLASELMRRVLGQARPRMPFDGPPYLSETEIGLIEKWILDGARDSSGNAAPAVTGRRVRLHGTLDGDGRLDGLEINVDSGTRRDERVRAGDYVRVRGTIDEGGNFVAERIQDR